MGYDRKVQEQLKNLIYTGKFDEFKKLLSNIKTNDLSAFQKYLYGSNDEGRSLLSWMAIKKGGVGFIDYLFVGLGTNTINLQDDKQRTALSGAIEHNIPENVRKLVLYGADVSLADYKGDTPLHLAAHGGSENIFELLFAKGAAINAVNKQGATPLHLAAHYSLRALHSMVKYRKDDVKKLLNTPDQDGDTPLHYAACDESGHNATYLLMLGADRTIINKDGVTPAQAAVEWDSEGCTTETAILAFTFNPMHNPEAYYMQAISEEDNLLMGNNADYH